MIAAQSGHSCRHRFSRLLLPFGNWLRHRLGQHRPGDPGGDTQKNNQENEKKETTGIIP